MDKALFIGTHGAKNTMHEMEVVTNNLANVNTTGFRADFEVMKQYQMKDGEASRSYAVRDHTYSDFKAGPLIHTERDLDVAVSGRGFIAVQSKSGKEAYTRAGDLQVRNGFLTTQSGELIMGQGGLINVGIAERFSIGQDGSISAKIKGAPNFVNINRIKLVSPNLTEIQKGTDGLFYPTGNAGTAKADDKLRVTTGMLEGSNVNPVETLTTLIELSREFEMHTNLMRTMKEDSSKANQILELPR